MESTVPVVRFVKCPKCLKILTEFAEIPVYKCGGCGAILRAKARSSSGQNLSTVSAKPASKDLPDSDPLSNESESLRQKIPASTNINNLKVSDSSGENIFEESLGNERNEIKSLDVSDSNGEIHEPKREPSGLEGTSSGERFEQGNEALEVSPNINPEAYDSLKSSDKLEESSETMQHCTTSEEDMINMEFGNGTNFRMSNRSSSHAYDGSVSSADEDRKDYIPDKYRLSRRTFRNKNLSDSFHSAKAGEDYMRISSNERFPSACNPRQSSIHDDQAMEQDSFFTSQVVRRKWIQSENDKSSSSPTKDANIKINHRFSEQYGRVKILNKVDELRNELSGLLNETANDKGSSLFGVKKSQFQGKVPSKEHRSSLIPFSRQPSSSYFQCYPEDKCCHNEHCRPCPHNVCCHLNEAASLPPQKQNSNINEETQNLQYKASRPQTRLCRPVSGGAPFVICYKCFKLLQLPVDFLVSPKRLNKLRCGACSQLLMYCFRPRSRSILQTPADVQHPPSEENLAPRYKEFTGWDPISTSEESGLSFAKSSSSEVEPALHKSRSFDGIIEEEQGEDREVSGSRLHNLMGYFSASELLFHSSYSHDGYPSTDSDRPNFYRPGIETWERN